MNIVSKAINILNKKYGIKNVEYAIVTGSGLGASCPELKGEIKVPYKNLGLPASKVKGHSGHFVFGAHNGKNVMIVSRMHYYESGDITKVRMPLEIAAGLGVKNVVLLTSCGGLNKTFEVGDVMLINDQINMSGVNPLVGMEEIKFVDMTNCYNPDLKKLTKKICKKHNIDLKEGVFCQMSGPSYETKAEVNMLRKLGGDAVSMSTAHDCIIANYYNMNVLGFAAIVNVFEGQVQKLTHQEVLENAEKINKKLKVILSNLI